jgi:hypothetical protein
VGGYVGTRNFLPPSPWVKDHALFLLMFHWVHPSLPSALSFVLSFYVSPVKFTDRPCIKFLVLNGVAQLYLEGKVQLDLRYRTSFHPKNR